MQHTGTVLLEREAELAALSDALTAAVDGRGSVVLVEGPAGIGKTRLLEAARDLAADARMTVTAARPSELDREFPFGVVRQLFEPIVAGADAPLRARLLHGAAMPAAVLLGGEVQASVTETDPSWAHFHALYWLAANLAEQAPVALVVDDLHWADASSLRFLRFLAPRLPELPVVV